MNLEHLLIFLDKKFTILNTEKEFIIHPAAFDLLPMSKASLQCSFQSEYYIEKYQLYLDRLIIHPSEPSEMHYDVQACPLVYNGAILIGANLLKEYYVKGSTKPTCFSYQDVIELIFEEGILITSIDQSKAMSRIRKNLELNLRNLTRGRDLRCISRFMNSAFVGDYNEFKLPILRMKYLQDMRDEYKNINLRNKTLVS